MTIPMPVVPPITPVAVRPALGSITTDRPPDRRSFRLDLRHALAASEVSELLTQVSGGRSAKPWHRWAPSLVLFQGLTGAQLARLRTDDFSFIHGHGWISVPRPGHADDAPGLPPLMIPLHTQLVDAEFHGFAHSRFFDVGEETFLFPELAWAARPGDAVESWLRRATRPWANDGRHAPTLRDLRATAAQAALDGGAPVHMVEAWMGLAVTPWDDRGPRDADGRAQLLREWVWEAVDAVRYPMPPNAKVRASEPAPAWAAALNTPAPIVMPCLAHRDAEGEA